MPTGGDAIDNGSRKHAILKACSPPESPSASTDPKSVRVNQLLVWNGNRLARWVIRAIPSLRDARPCACEDERGKAGRARGAGELAPGASMFKAAAKLSPPGVGKYAIKFSWNDSHDLGIYSWAFLREVCPCAECKAERAQAG